MKSEWILPSQKEAKSRTKQQSEIQRDLFELPEGAKHLGDHRKFFLKTFGCQANVRDGETMAGILAEMGYEYTEDAQEADFILLNTCAIRANAENKVFGEIGNSKHLKRANPDLIIGICGCMMQEENVVRKVLMSYPHVDLIFGTHNIHRLPDLLYQATLSKERTVEVYSKEGDVIENLPVQRFGKGKAWVNIMYGCDKFCTYCIVPFTRGKERSRLLEDIIIEVNELIADGYKEVTLLGQNVNAYGKDLKLEGGFATLLEEVAKTGIPRVRFTTSHPWDFTDEMIATIAKYDNIMPFIHLPVQSGDNAILKIMGRRYTVESYMEIYHKLKEVMPDCAFSSDIIVGFPNESDEQFEKTMALVEACQYDNVYTFIYSAREGTPAANMEDNIPMDVKKARLARLNEKVKEHAALRNEAYVGRVVEVLVDGPSRKQPSIYSGYTDTQKLVNFKVKQAQVNEIVKVRITEAKTFFLIGEEL